MKKILIVLLTVAMLAFAGVVIAGVNMGDPGIGGTPHDIPTFVSGKGNTEPCAYCHTPHVAGDVVYPLWNRSQPNKTYTMYTSPTMDMTFTSNTSDVLDMSTRACMQCHNGQDSILVNYPGRANLNADTKYNFTGTNLGNFANLGTDLRQEHPVSFTYASGNDTNGQNNFPTVSNNKVAGYYPLYGVSVAVAPTLMGCGTCHEPHDRFSYGGKSTGSTGTQVFFLRNGGNGDIGNAGSDMCKTCHVAKY